MAFALEVEYLCGKAVATERHARERAEWPPHPGRLFSALVAALHEGDFTPAEFDAGVAALTWLENQGGPSLAVADAKPRDVLTVFVPVNDSAAPDKPPVNPSAGQVGDAVAVLPERRPKQPRYFPTVVPDSPVVTFVWPLHPEGPGDFEALQKLAAAVTYLGHSSSLVRVAVVEEIPNPITFTYVPDENGTHTLRVPSGGRLKELKRDFDRHARPSPGVYAAYRKLGEADRKPAVPKQAGPAFGDMIVCELDGPFLPLVGMIRLTDHVRDRINALTDDGNKAVKSLVSGHADDGGLSQETHVAFVPLAFVGHRYADAGVMGFAVVLPRTLSEGPERFGPTRRAIVRAVAELPGVEFAGRRWGVTLAAVGEGKASLRPGPYAADAEPWAGWSRCWATVTPILCDRYPKEKDGQRVEDVVRESVRQVAGVTPTDVVVGPVSRHLGVPASHDFLHVRKESDPRRHRVHAWVRFDRPVRGPLIVGRGRYLGFGLFRVVEPRREGGR